MRGPIVVFVMMTGLAAPALAQTTPTPSAPAEIGNRANGKDYQPTPNEVAPREQSAGVLPNVAHQQAENKAVEQIDRDALNKVGQSTQSVPNMAKGQQ